MPNGEAQRRTLTVAPGAVTALLEELARTPSESGGALPGFQPGQVVGRFEILREIGRGGFGQVYEARDRELGRRVAFKALRTQGKPEVKAERLLREAEAAARLSHPNIVTLYDVGRCEQGPYLVLELLEGRTLAERRAQGALSLREALRIGVEVAKGVAHAHAHGVVHRDLTPGNVFLCDDGQVKVLDFGMAHVFGQRRVDGGTRAYMAPEQARGAPEDERTDVFALGVILHEMLSGELPFPDAEALASSGRAPGLEVPEAPALGELVGRVLEKDPVKRPRDAGEVLTALTAFQRELERLPSTGSAPVRTRRRSSGLGDFLAELKRRRVMRALLGYAIVSFAILQIVEPVLHGLHLPDSTLSVVVVLIGIGFPVTVALAWVFDLTARGVAPTPERKGMGLRGPRLALLLVGLGLLAATPGLGWYFLRQGGFRTTAETRNAPPAPIAPSVAVLPFADMSPAKDQEYFADGIAEEILNALAQVEGLRVSGRTSSFSFKGKAEDLRVIGQKLGVETVLEGSVRKAGGRIRITAQLVKTADGFHLWSQTFDRDLSDIFAVQDEIARAVVQALRLRLLPEKADTLAGGTASNEAYNQYLLGRDLLRTRSADSGERALAAFEKALSLDPGYAQAWAGVANALSFIDGVAGVGVSPERRRRWVHAAERAIELAPDLITGHVTRAYLRGWLQHDWRGAQADLERARALGPGTSGVARLRGRVFLAMGRVPEAVAALEEAAATDPLSAESLTYLGAAYLSAGEAARARTALARALEVAPRDESARYYLCAALLTEGQPDAALAAAETATLPWVRLTCAALAHHVLGRIRESQAALDALVAADATDASYQIAEAYAWRGEPDLAFEWLERARVEKDPGISWIKTDPLLRKIRGDPRFAALLRKLNLPPD